MNISECISLLIIFCIVFYSVFKKKTRKSYEVMTNPNTIWNKNKKIMPLGKKSVESLNLTDYSLKDKSISSNKKIDDYKKEEKIENDSYFKNIEEVRKGILFMEILNREMVDEFI